MQGCIGCGGRAVGKQGCTVVLYSPTLLPLMRHAREVGIDSGVFRSFLGQ